MLTDGRTDDERKVITIAHPEQSSGELKKHVTSKDSYKSVQDQQFFLFFFFLITQDTQLVISLDTKIKKYKKKRINSL